MTYLKKLSAAALCAASLIHSATAMAQSDSNEIEEILVLSEFSPVSLDQSASSVSIITSQAIEQRSATFLTETLAAVANLNSASGASRGRFFQIRGIGERSQFVDPLNPSVGLVIDGVDFSTLGGAAVLIDSQQVEVLRGPQGTLFGANALAGIISIKSNDPQFENSGQVSTGISNISDNDGALDAHEVSFIGNIAASDTLAARLAVAQVKSDGSMSNSYLGRDDTQNIDEQTARLKLLWQPSDDLSARLSLLSIQTDNGYDAFTLDNSRQSLADQPGKDTLNTQALTLDTRYQLNAAVDLQILLSHADSESEYSYDEDWTNPDICTGQPCAGWEYASFDQYLRDITNRTIDARLLGSDDSNWVVGLFQQNRSSDLVRNYTYSGPFSSQFDADNTALYGQRDWAITGNTSIITGLRFEAFDADYQDLVGQRTRTSESLLGGHVTLEHAADGGAFTYLRVAKGYKSGGVNTSTAVSPAIPLEYETESLWNYELGYRNQFASGARASIVLFYQDRHDAQVKQSLVSCPATQPQCSFEDYTDNAAEAHSLGIETEYQTSLNEQLSMSLSLGLLQAEFDSYESFSHMNANTAANPGAYSLDGKVMAHSPEYQASLSFDYLINDQLSLWLAYDVSDGFRFSNRHFAEADDRALLNANLTYQLDSVRFSLWARNLTNETYSNRGFGSFPNDPRDFYSTNGPYVQLGEPRQVGINASYNF